PMARRERDSDATPRNADSRTTGVGRVRRQSRRTLQPASQAKPVTTYSIAACDLDASQWGVATQSKFLAVGSVVPWAEPQVGAIATQAYANPRYGPQGLRLLREGLAAEEVVERLTSGDEGRDHRQLGVVDREGRSASFTGSTACMRRSSARRRGRNGSRSTRLWRTSCASGSRSSATTASWRMRSTAGQATSTSRNAWTESRRSTRSCSRSCGN